MAAVALALAASLAWGASDFLAGLKSRDVAVLSVLVVSQGAGCAALTFGLTGMVAVLGSTYPITTVLLARVLLHDRIERRQELGVGGALVGVVLVTVA